MSVEVGFHALKENCLYYYEALKKKKKSVFKDFMMETRIGWVSIKLFCLFWWWLLNVILIWMMNLWAVEFLKRKKFRVSRRNKLADGLPIHNRFDDLDLVSRSQLCHLLFKKKNSCPLHINVAILVATYSKKIKLNMLCVTGVYSRDITLIFSFALECEWFEHVLLFQIASCAQSSLKQASVTWVQTITLSHTQCRQVTLEIPSYVCFKQQRKIDYYV